MNRNDFMRQLESLLQNIAQSERDEALQYYNDYFDDAGRENENEVIEALGNPARVAESIRRDLLGASYGEGAGRKALASDRALMEYGEGGESRESEGGAGSLAEADRTGRETSGEACGEGQKEAAESSSFQDSGCFRDSVHSPEQDGPQNQDVECWERDVDGKSGKKSDMPAWCVALLVTLVILFSPLALGIFASALAAALGLVVAWFGMMFAFGGVSLALLAVLVIMSVVGRMCIPVNPWVGMSLVGGGLICGAIGILFLMLTVAMGGVLPALFRGVASLFRRKKAVRG